MKVQRHAQILEHLRAHHVVSVEDLARALEVSASTVRRDLQQLHLAGALTRVHGGAAPREHLQPHPVQAWEAQEDRTFDQAVEEERPDKEVVAAAAAEQVLDGEVVALDIGTTTAAVARHLRGRPITVVTNSLAVLDVLRDDATVELILLGGVVRRSYHSLVGMLTEDALRQVALDRVFLGTSGIDADGRVMDTTIVEVPVKRRLLAAAREVVVLADQRKLPGTGSYQVCGPEQVDMLVTNKGADAETLRACQEAGVKVVCR
ncbi:DeoR/GlpR family DNA-binding transcription regulator [Demetria terragena]|uniref:DeoR/GlpR family DNA-binding transcription regulator n=1 Tax=Demetria terragena TaxID=63959 RepID=UPI0003A8C9CC|nr:DeoR/GlpR family DNA-binding transcription regulator [Demetria terragena]